MRAISPFLALFFILLTGCVAQDLSRKSIIVGGVPIDVNVADTQAARSQGLMGVQRLGEDEGMLFVFDGEGRWPFWMKNTLIPLDIIFVSTNGTVVDIQTMEPCTTDSCGTYTPKADMKYAIEVNKGFAEKNGIMAGQKARIE